MVSVLKAHIISGIFESILYGIFFVLSTVSLGLLVRRHRGKFPTTSSWHGWMRVPSYIWFVVRNSPLIVANVLLIGTVTAHCATSAHRLVLAFVYHDGHEQETDFLNLLEEKTQVIRLVLLFLDMFIGDLVITYRVWLVWERRAWIVVLPSLTTVALLGTGIAMIHQFLVSKPSGSVFDPAVNRWIEAYCAMTFFTNIYGTAVIAYRIWATNRSMKNLGLYDGGRSLLESMAIFVESAALYSAWGIFYVIVYGLKSHLEIIGTGCAPTILGVTFMLITVRVGLGWAQESRIYTQSIGWARPSESRSGQEVIPALSFARATDSTLEDQASISLGSPRKDPTLSGAC
ncbi:hypothetical protein K466DRAFT_269660 [Polyporus arcularius HHB13444]|uniref:Uncharacterized protein n=1 Tax=Polyporus arcularius HHB13444 TaxID=1314778 RepID=A0A5C3PQT5_9APHY|nr:hypothetical protein K466DRAFT_269660 [Polyporus arcularius HHB13444]